MAKNGKCTKRPNCFKPPSNTFKTSAGVVIPRIVAAFLKTKLTLKLVKFRPVAGPSVESNPSSTTVHITLTWTLVRFFVEVGCLIVNVNAPEKYVFYGMNIHLTPPPRNRRTHIVQVTKFFLIHRDPIQFFKLVN